MRYTRENLWREESAPEWARICSWLGLESTSRVHPAVARVVMDQIKSRLVYEKFKEQYPDE